MIDLYETKDYQISAATTLKDIDSIKKIWEHMAWHPTVDPDVIIAEFEETREKTTPFVMLVRKKNVAAGFLVAMIKTIHVELKLKYYTIFKVRAKVLSILDNGIIGSEDPEIARLMVLGVKTMLKNNCVEIDYVHFACLNKDSLIRHILKKDVSKRYLIEREYEQRWRLKLSGSYKNFLMARSRKTRYNIKRNEKKLLSAFPSLKIEIYSPGTTSTHQYDNIISLIQKTYQYRLGLTPLAPPNGKILWQRLSFLNRIAASIVSIEEVPIAFSWAHIYKETGSFGTPGYDPDYRELDVGEFCNLRLIEKLANNRTISILDYGLGYSEYKKRLGSEYELQGHVLLFAPTDKGINLKKRIKFFDMLNKSVTKIIEKMGLKTKIKRVIRSR